jgi:hyperosmotically inducible protein
MKGRLLTTCVMVGALMAPFASYSAEDADRDRSNPKQWVKDSAITAKVKAKMAKDKDVSALHIKVDTDNRGVVQLSGTARSQAEAEKAVQIAQGVEGVTSVDNRIHVDKDR